MLMFAHSQDDNSQQKHPCQVHLLQPATLPQALGLLAANSSDVPFEEILRAPKLRAGLLGLS